MSKQELPASRDLNPEVEQILRDPAASFWIKEAVQTALARDPVDAADDADVLAEALSRRCRRLLHSEMSTSMRSVDFFSEPLILPSCHVCGTRMEPVCPQCGATSKPTAPATAFPK